METTTDYTYIRDIATWRVIQLPLGTPIPEGEGWEPATAAQYQEYKEAMDWESWEQDQETGHY